MKKNSLVFFLLLISYLSSMAAYDTLRLNSNVNHVDLSRYAWVKNNTTQRLEKWTKNSLNFGIYNGMVEVHFFITADTNVVTTIPLFLALENQAVDSIQLQYSTGLQQKTFPVIGREIPYHVRGNKFRHYVWPIDMVPGQTLELRTRCYIFCHTLQLPFSLHTRQAYFEKENQTNLLLGFCFGTTLLMLLVVIFLYLSSNEVHLIYYALHIVFMLLWQLSFYGFFAAYLWPEKPILNFYGHHACGTLAAIFQITFMLTYFRIKPPQKVFYVFRALRGAFIAIIPFVIAMRWFNGSSFQVLAYFYVALLFLYIATILYYLIVADKKLLEVRMLIAACGVVGTLSMLRVFEVAGITNSSWLVSNSITLGQYFELIIFTGGLAYSFAIYKKNYIRKIIEINDMQKAHYESTIQVIDEERNRIATDLHDMLGSQLAGIKLKTQLCFPRHENTHDIVTDLDDAYSQLRTLAKDLKTIDWEFYSLYETLQAKVHYVGSISSIHFHMQPTKPHEGFLNATAKRHLYAIASELLLNVLKHSHATECVVSLFNPCSGKIQLDMKDNGCGAVMNMEKGIGLKNIQERIKTLGGQVLFDSDNEGWAVSVIL